MSQSLFSMDLMYPVNPQMSLCQRNCEKDLPKVTMFFGVFFIIFIDAKQTKTAIYRKN